MNNEVNSNVQNNEVNNNVDANVQAKLNEKPSKPVEEVKMSGTATEEEIQIDATKEKTEVLDEYEINKDIQQEKKKFKKNWIFIIVIVLLIIGFILCLPLITKKVGF